MSAGMPGLLHLAAAVGRPDERDADALVAAVRLAERGGLDFVTFGDPAAPAGPGVLAALPAVAAATERVGLVPALPGGPTGSGGLTGPGWPDGVSGTRVLEPGVPGAVALEAGVPGIGVSESGVPEAGVPGIGVFQTGVPEAVGELDRVSRGRGGWWSDPAPRAAEGAATREPVSGARPVRVAGATGAPDAAARCADVVLVPASGPAQAAGLRAELRALAAESGRDPDGLRVLATLLVDLDGEYAAERGHGGGGPRPTPRGPLYRGGPVDLAELIASWHAEGAVDGFHLTPVDPRRDLERLVNGTVALLQHRALFRTFYPGGTLRDHLGLARPRALT
ncbi:FMNH2-dependent monooxygenase [Streptomyces griseosporeus]|uniref:FMNH2-dependent monooxygenase n=1 Tax=Streptomyces griseosporeus TaxID=1910 RepID=UPI0037BBFF44